MPQIHLNSEIINRIRDGKQTALVSDKHNYFVYDSLGVREQWAKDSHDRTLYKADHPELARKMDWKSSVLMFKEDVRMILIVAYSIKTRISELTDEQVLKLGHQSRESFHKEWNMSLAKKDRPTLAVKKDPEIYYFEFMLTK